jgi:hypothetical protein
MRTILIVVLMLAGFEISFAQTNVVTLHTNSLPKINQTTKSSVFDKDNVTNIVTLLAVVVGAALGVGIDFIRKKLEIRRVKLAIVQELEDSRAWLLRNKLTVEHLIQLSVLKQELNQCPVPVPTQIYANNYASVAIYFNKHERVSINAIHNLIQYADKQSGQLEQLIQESLSNKADEKRDEKTRVLLAGLHSNINLAIIHISNHIAYKKDLNVMGLGGNLEAIDKDEKVRIQELVAEARQLGSDGLKEKHYKI